MRKSGVLMHISSLPSPYGIGTVGAAAREFVDFLSESSQSFWQLLPVAPTGFGDSPYQSFSAFAGNPYFIDLDTLANEGFLKREDYVNLNWGADPTCVDYGLLYKTRYPALRKAAERLFSEGSGDFSAFCAENAFWLEDYALFMALKDSHGGAAWSEWEKPLRFREAAALERARAALSADVFFYKALQFFFYSQWRALHEYAAEKGVSIIGDIPIYVAPDSADVWAKPELFQLDSDLRPVEVSGCPPDGFSADGQLWGNPLYDWEKHAASGYEWWITRIRHSFEVYDVLRIDHFRGFDAYYAIPYGDDTARNGRWREGPGYALFAAIKASLGEKPIIAEDLGFLTDSVRKLLADCGYPGMKILQFAFDSREESDYLPHNFPKNCVAYTGTHDNDTIIGWFQTAPRDDVNKAKDYMRLHEGESGPRCMLSTLWGSVAELAIAQMQDLLELGHEGRMNTPGTSFGNWQWRMKPETDLSEPSRWLKHLTELYGRL